MKTLVVEDEGAARRRLEGIVEKHPVLQLVGSASTGIKAIELINRNIAELLIMDIQLKDLTAFDVLNRVEKDYSGNIIFITAYNDFAVRAFEVFAIDYVLKPYTEARLLNAFDRCLKTRKMPSQEVYSILESLHFRDKICIPEGKTSHLFEKDQIEWIEADGYHCKLYSSDKEVQLIRILLKDINQLLPDNYVRISRSIIINMNQVLNYKNNNSETHFRMRNGKEFFGKLNYLKEN